LNWATKWKLVPGRLPVAYNMLIELEQSDIEDLRKCGNR